jgi:predicted amidohydrolase
MRSVDADLFVLPELFATGYNFTDVHEAGALAEHATGMTFQRMASMAGEKNAFVSYGFAERDDRLYNSAALVGPRGLVGIYRKVHLFFRETIFFAPGNLGFPVFELPFGRVGMMICFDWFYPESARTLALKGADIVAHPSNLVLPHCPDAMVTRCLENRIYTATANRVGTENRGEVSLTFIGKSEIVSPGGEILVRLGTDQTLVGVADCDPARARSKRLNEYNDLFGGRRPGEYSAV